jgi:putative FmdB family regulatory protein
MPIYDMKCSKCGHEFENLRDINATRPLCPECGGPTDTIIRAPRLIPKPRVFDKPVRKPTGVRVRRKRR